MIPAPAFASVPQKKQGLRIPHPRHCCVFSPTISTPHYSKFENAKYPPTINCIVLFFPKNIMEFPENWPCFFTATNLNWLPLLLPDMYKDVIINSLTFLVKQQRAKVFAFVILGNHLHLILQVLSGYKPEPVQRNFLKFTGQ